ncbi:MAG: hypothetical protein ACLQUZ_05635 [Rhizomicrobium sp.]
MIDFSQYFQLARDISTPRSRGAPRKVHLRRAISTAYYGLFHCLSDWATCALVGESPARRKTPDFRLVYRSFQHGEMRSACEQAGRPLPPEFGIKMFCPELRFCASTFVELQKRRHEADYDPHAEIVLSDAQDAVAGAETAAENLRIAPEDQRVLFLLTLRYKHRP